MCAMTSATVREVSPTRVTQLCRRRQFGRLVEDRIHRIESADFLPHSGILAASPRRGRSNAIKLAKTMV